MLFFALLFGLLFLSVPVGFSLGIAASVCVFFVLGVPLEAGMQRVVVATDSFTLLAVPLFMLAGNIMAGGGIAKRLIDFVDSLMGWMKGGLSMVSIAASACFGSICGSSAATAVAIGSIMIPGMKEKGYDEAYAAGVVASSAPLGAIIPPSIIMITYGTLTGVSVTALFIGGIIPGIIIATTMCVVSYFVCRKHSYASGTVFSVKAVTVTAKRATISLMMPIIILGGIYSGLFTPTEAAAVATVYVMIISIFVYKQITIKDLPRIFIETAQLSGGIMFLVSTASLCGWTLALGRVPQMVTEAMMSVSESPIVIMLLMNILLLLVGCFLDSIAAMVILIPILFPLIQAYGIDPVHFGIIASINIAIGTFTPPFGVNLFVTSGMTGIPVEKIARGGMMLLVVMIIDLLVMSYIPAITTFLPNLMN